MMTPVTRKFALTAHITCSVGWVGAVATFLALSLVGALGRDPETVRSAYIAMNSIGILVIVPLSLASLATGLLQALGSPWGLFRHYWVLSKLLLNLLATGLLLLHQYMSVSVAAQRALITATGVLPSLGQLAIQQVFDASLAVLTLVTATAFAIYKPKGLTPYGQRKVLERNSQAGSLAPETSAAVPSLGLRLFIGVLASVMVVFLTVHLTGLSGNHMH
jgi:hypothetical protein